MDSDYSHPKAPYSLQVATPGQPIGQRGLSARIENLVF
jgi:hypothetical protein